MQSVIIILYVAVSLLLVLVIMLQPGKGSGLGAIGGEDDHEPAAAEPARTVGPHGRTASVDPGDEDAPRVQPA